MTDEELEAMKRDAEYRKHHSQQARNVLTLAAEVERLWAEIERRRLGKNVEDWPDWMQQTAKFEGGGQEPL